MLIPAKLGKPRQISAALAIVDDRETSTRGTWLTERGVLSFYGLHDEGQDEVPHGVSMSRDEDKEKTSGGFIRNVSRTD